jgi:hypothetical protein
VADVFLIQPRSRKMESHEDARAALEEAVSLVRAIPGWVVVGERQGGGAARPRASARLRQMGEWTGAAQRDGATALPRLRMKSSSASPPIVRRHRDAVRPRLPRHLRLGPAIYCQ